MKAYGRLFSFRLEDGFVLSNISHLLFINDLREAYSLNWLSWKPVILDFLSEMFLIFIVDVINLYDVSVCY